MPRLPDLSVVVLSGKKITFYLWRSALVPVLSALLSPRVWVEVATAHKLKLPGGDAKHQRGGRRVAGRRRKKKLLSRAASKYRSSVSHYEFTR